ncbi:LAFA_0C03642g1_1 [Lachancea sp. 'fantastica']|nr:LAFA_0C03642g1_1 [Lachancea sp. 'fantastica']
MRLLVACDDSGSIKEVLCNRKTDTSVQTAPQPFHIGTHLTEGLANRVEIMQKVSDDSILVARANGTVQVLKLDLVSRPEENQNSEIGPNFDISDLKVVSSVQGLLDDSVLLELHKKSKKRSTPRDGFIALQTVPGASDKVVCASKSGHIHILSLKDNKLHIFKSHAVKAPLEFVQFYDNQIDVASKKRFTTLAYGGEENLIKLAKLSPNFDKLEQFWQAKNVSNDKLDLKVPIWPMQLKFMNPTPDADVNGDDYHFLALNRLGHIREYDTKRGRKPKSSHPLLPKNEIATNLQVLNTDLTPLGNIKSESFDNLEVLITDSKRNVLACDTSPRTIGKYGAGEITGATTFVSVVEKKYLLQCGLDRYVRIFDVESRALLCKVYLGAKASSVLLIDDQEVEVPQPESSEKKRKVKDRDVEAEALEDEEIWTTLEGTAKKTRTN